MGKTIFITEKPSVAQDYKRVLKVSSGGKTNGYIEGHSPVLGKDVIITWAVGHLIAISQPEKQNPAWEGAWKKENLPMIPNSFKYEPIKNTYSQYKVIKEQYTRKDIDAIYYAGDSGREGIYIQALIRNQVFKTSPKVEERVVWLNSTTDESIIKGIQEAKPYTHYQSMIDSGYMRAISDWLIGMNFTESFTLTSNTLINVGRVMTPTLAMVVNRQYEIDNFHKTPYFGIKADNFASWKAVNGSRFFESDDLYNENGFLKKEKSQALCSEFNTDKKLMVFDTKITTKTEYAPYLFNLADLQAYCTKHFKISPAKALEIVQSLYEKKFTTYPRTDCRFLSSAVATDLKKQGYDVPKRYVDDSKVTDHYALIPTFHGNANELDGTEKSVYNVILERFTNTMLPPYIYDAVSVTYIHRNGEKFFENYRIIKQLGFKANSKDTEEEKAENKSNNDEAVSTKPVPQKGDVISVNNFSIHEMETKPPVAYTTGSLILAMEKAGKLIEDEELREQIKTCGIGTSATRAGIIDKLVARKYITVDNKQKVAPTEFGKSIIPIIALYDKALVSPEKTADMEASLNAVATSKLSKEGYLEKIVYYVSRTTQRILDENKLNLSAFSTTSDKVTMSKELTCPCCGDKMKVGKFGWYCGCKFSIGLEISEHKMKEKDVEDLCAKGRTKKLSFKSKSGKPFTAYLAVDTAEHKVKFVFDEAPTGDKSASEEDKTKFAETRPKKVFACPICNQTMNSGTSGLYCDCGLRIYREISGHKMTAKEIETLFACGRLDDLSFISRAGKPFAASLVLDKEAKKTAFEFSDSDSNTASAAQNEPKHSGKVYKCPCCGGQVKGEKYGWHCSCGFSLGYDVCGEKMTEEDIEGLCTNGSTNTHTFRSKKGKQFRASLSVDTVNRRTVFEYSNDWN